PPGYRIHVDSSELDVTRFEALVESGATAMRRGEPSAAAAALRDALELWRGPALAGFDYEAFATPEAARLEELRLVVIEDPGDALRRPRGGARSPARRVAGGDRGDDPAGPGHGRARHRQEPPGGRGGARGRRRRRHHPLRQLRRGEPSPVRAVRRRPAPPHHD